ncbi:MAG: afsK 2, partial [Planctomycetaceae bacterium]|nr:afsK 2 [Planctomycetaceae bacterium]
MLRRIACSCSICVCLVVGSLSAADWRQFRGTDSTGIAANEVLPTSWTPTENIAWKANLPGRGISGPIIVGNRVFVTASSGKSQDRLHVLGFDADTGKELWERQFWATGRTMCHPKMAVATPQPASDGQRIFAFYSSNDLVCLDLDGNLLWFRGLGLDFPNASNSLGMSSSPVVIGDTVIVQVESDSESFAAGLDVTNGQQRWKIDRPKMSNWTSPGVFKGATPAEDLVLLQSGKGLTAYSPIDGKQVWSFDNGASTIPSTGINGEILMIPSNGLTAVKVDAASKNPKQLWNESKLGPGTSSPVVYDGKVYILGRGSVLTCASVEDGKTLWQLRVKGDGGFSATPVLAGGHLYLVNENGSATVVKLGGEKGEIVGGGDLGETIL